MMLDNFSIGELSIAMVSVIGAIALCMRGSKCSRIDTPCCKIKREIPIKDLEMDVVDDPNAV